MDVFQTFTVLQKWRKELAKHREKLMGGSEKEKDKRTIDKDKDEKKDKREV